MFEGVRGGEKNGFMFLLTQHKFQNFGDKYCTKSCTIAGAI